MKIHNLLALFIIITLLGMVQVHALNFDNVKKVISTENKYPDIKIDNSFGIGQTILKGHLISNTEQCSDDCEAVIKIELYEPLKLNNYNDDFNLLFTDVKSNKNKQVNHNIYIANEYTTKTIIDWEDCRSEINSNFSYSTQCTPKSKEVKELDYKELDLKSELASGEYYIKIVGHKDIRESIDWKPHFFGVTFDEWALWGAVTINNLYHFDEDSNTKIDSGNATKNITTSGGNMYSSIGYIGGSLKGNNIDYLNFSNITKGKSAISVSFWYRDDSWQFGEVIFEDSAYIPYAGGENFYLLSNDCAYTNRGFCFATNRSYLSTAIPSLSDGTWHHIVISVNNTAGLLYYDGYLNVSNYTFAGRSYNGSFEVYTGSRYYSSPLNESKYIDEFGVFNKMLNASEVYDIYINNYTSYTGNSVIINSPQNDSSQISKTVNYNCSAYSINPYTLTNISLLDNSTGVYKINSTYTISSLMSYNAIFNINYSIDGQIRFACRACTSDHTCGITENRTINLGLTSFNYLFSPDTYETKLELFTSNITFNPLVYTGVSALLIYNGTEYEASKLDMTNGAMFYRYLTVPTLLNSTPVNKSFYWRFSLTNITGALEYINGTVFYQNSKSILFNYCNSTGNKYINFSFYNETINKERVKSNIVSSFEYGLSPSSKKLFTFSNSSYNNDYTFCFSPIDQSLYLTGDIYYGNAESAIRGYSFADMILTNVTSYTNLSLLPTTSGTDFIVHTVDQGGEDLEDVLIIVNRSGYGIVEAKYSDGAGLASFFLDPSFMYQFCSYKEGYTSECKNINPSSGATYTLTLFSSNISTSYDISKGINILFSPAVNTLVNSTPYTFAMTINASNNDLQSYGYNLYSSSGVLLFSGVGSNTNGGTISSGSINTGNYLFVRADYFYIINGINTSRSITWVIKNTQGRGYSIQNMLDRFKGYVNDTSDSDGLYGLKNRTGDNFSLSLIVFVVIIITSGIVVQRYGLTTPFPILVVITALVFFIDIVLGLLPQIGGVEHSVTIILSIATVLLFIREELV